MSRGQHPQAGTALPHLRPADPGRCRDKWDPRHPRHEAPGWRPGCLCANRCKDRQSSPHIVVQARPGKGNTADFARMAPWSPRNPALRTTANQTSASPPPLPQQILGGNASGPNHHCAISGCRGVLLPAVGPSKTSGHGPNADNLSAKGPNDPDKHLQKGSWGLAASQADNPGMGEDSTA